MMIDTLKKEGFSDRILEAFEKVPREYFVPEEHKEKSYEDMPLPIAGGQTISQPYTVAFMLSLLGVEEGQKVLDVGSGSGYVLALLSKLNKTGQIKGIEVIKELAEKSRDNLEGYKNVEVIQGNVLRDLGNEEFDRIIVDAAFEEIPTDIINNNLKFKGKMIVPVRNSIYEITKESGENKVKEYPGFRFVPIIKE